MSSWLREPGGGKYARLEREFRVLLAQVPEGLGVGRVIDDRYVDGTTLRLRRVHNRAEVVHKLTQKVRLDGGDPSVVSITNIYLTESEYDVLAALPGQTLSKVRREWSPDGRAWVVDEFLGRWHGLVLAELERSGDDVVPELPAGLDVTSDDRFSGGVLAGATDEQAEVLLAWVRGAVVGGAD
jgi:CYTH domain-containing protein